MKEKNWTKWVYWFTFAVAVIFVYKTLDSFDAVINAIGNVLSILMPFIMSILIAYIFYIPSKYFEKIYKKIPIFNKHSKFLGIITVYIIAIILITIIIKFIVPTIIDNIVELINNLPAYYNSITKTISELPEDSIIKQIDFNAIIKSIQQLDVKSLFSLETISGYAKGVLGIAHTIFNIFVTIIVSIYILLEREQILDFIKKAANVLFKKHTYDNLGNYFKKTNIIFFKFITSQLLDAVIIGVLLSITLTIMNVKYGAMLGIIIGLFNIIPYIGAIIASVIAIIITIFTGGIGQAIWMAIVVIIMQQIDANIINPKIVGNSLKLSPILIIFAVTVGGACFGILGMFLAVPIVAILKILILDYINYKDAVKQNNIS